jgi:hypothetical protein
VLEPPPDAVLAGRDPECDQLLLGAEVVLPDGVDEEPLGAQERVEAVKFGAGRNQRDGVAVGGRGDQLRALPCGVDRLRDGETRREVVAQDYVMLVDLGGAS